MTCAAQNSRYTCPITSKKGVIGSSSPVLGAIKAAKLNTQKWAFNDSGFFIAHTASKFGGLCGRAKALPFQVRSATRIVHLPRIAARGAGFTTRLLGVIMTNALCIGTSAIRTIDHLYSLNDLHKASGNEVKHAPNRFLRLDQTKELISEICKSAQLQNCLQTLRGCHGGTYACKELVIAYAAWISAAFHLKVIRVFLSTQTAQPVQPLPAPKPNRIVVNATRLNDIYIDLGVMAKQLEALTHNINNAKLRIDGLALIESDLPPAWWEQRRLVTA
jgi:KilA-N domain